MTTMEIIDLTTMLADIVRQQESIIAQHRVLDGESGKKLAEKRDAAYSELDLLELSLRPLVTFTCGKEKSKDGDNYSCAD